MKGRALLAAAALCLLAAGGSGAAPLAPAGSSKAAAIRGTVTVNGTTLSATITNDGPGNLGAAAVIVPVQVGSVNSASAKSCTSFPIPGNKFVASCEYDATSWPPGAAKTLAVTTAQPVAVGSQVGVCAGSDPNAQPECVDVVVRAPAPPPPPQRPCRCADVDVRAAQVSTGRVKGTRIVQFRLFWTLRCTGDVGTCRGEFRLAKATFGRLDDPLVFRRPGTHVVQCKGGCKKPATGNLLVQLQPKGSVRFRPFPPAESSIFVVVSRFCTRAGVDATAWPRAGAARGASVARSLRCRPSP